MVWLRGDCHVHSALSSGGELTPAQVVAAARELGYDFIAATEHNTTENWAEWAALADDDLVIIPGQETTTPDGHFLTLGEGEAGSEDAGARVTVAAHPHAPYPGGTLKRPLREFDLIEVWNGQWRSSNWYNADNEAGLAAWARGLGTPGWPPAIGSSDVHLAGQIGTPHTVVRASGRTGNEIVNALKAGHSWIAGSAGIDLDMVATCGDATAGIGERLKVAGAAAQVRVEVRGLLSGVLTFHTDLGVARRAEVSGADVVTWQVGQAAYVRVEVRHPDRRMAALTNPIWFDR